jgi:glycosyltransferase involved in cell wall biosynthesis
MRSLVGAAVAERRIWRRAKDLEIPEGTPEAGVDAILMDRLRRPAPAEARREPRVTVVIPALNEAENLPHVLPKLGDFVDEVILVDGDSSDGTREVARALRPDIRTLEQIGRGKGNALCTGFAEATGDIIIMLDADGSTDPAEMPAFIGALLAGADFAKGSRFLQGGGTTDMPAYRRLGNKCFVLLVRLLFGGRYTDLCYGYNAFWSDLLPELALNGDGFEIETMMNIRTLRARLNVVEIASFEGERLSGVGRLRTIPDGWRVLKTIFRERFFAGKPSRLRSRERGVVPDTFGGSEATGALRD